MMDREVIALKLLRAILSKLTPPPGEPCERCGHALARGGGARCKVCGLPKGGSTPPPSGQPQAAPQAQPPQLSDRHAA